jgi:hypothetical protein
MHGVTVPLEVDALAPPKPEEELPDTTPLLDPKPLLVEPPADELPLPGPHVPVGPGVEHKNPIAQSRSLSQWVLHEVESAQLNEPGHGPPLPT